MRTLNILLVELLLASFSLSCGDEATGGVAVVPDGSNGSDGQDDPDSGKDAESSDATPGAGLDATVTTVSPVIRHVKPATGPTTGGTVVVLEGATFDPGARVFFGETEASSVVVLDSGRLVARAPAGQAGAADVAVENPSGGRGLFPNGFLYWTPGPESALAPSLADIVPNTAPTNGGSAVLLTGANFQEGATILIGWLPVDATTISSTNEASFVTPGLPAGNLDVSLTNPDGQSAVLAKAFSAYAGNAETPPAPRILSVFPVAGPTSGGTQVTVKGENFTASLIAILDGKKLTTWARLDDETATFTTPPHAAGVVRLAVTSTTDGQSGFLKNAFSYFTEPPVVYRVEPGQGPSEGGNLVTIIGDHFETGATVEFSGVPCTGVTVVSATQITCTAPPAVTASTVDIVVRNPNGLTAFLPAGYVYIGNVFVAPPTLTAVVPSHGPASGGYLVLVTGKDIQDGATVRFGGTLASATWVPGSGGIVATAPLALPGIVDITVANPDGQSATLAQAFTFDVVAPDVEPAKAIAVTLVQPPTGPTTGGGWALVHGALFVEGLSVYFGTSAASDITILSSTLAAVRVPGGAPGASSVSVVGPDGGTANVSDAYVYVTAKPGTGPNLVALTPGKGPVTGGTLALARGINLAPGALAFLDGRPATAVTAPATDIGVLRTPTGAAGPAELVWVNPDGQWAALPAAFLYGTNAPPAVTVTRVVPVQGPTAGGTPLAVDGTGFLPGSLLFFDDLPVDGAVASAVRIDAVAPPHAAGAVDISVTTPEGATATLANGYGYAVDMPVIYDVIPNHGPASGGVVVSVLGTSFAQGTMVTLGGKPCTGVSVTSSTELACTAPAGLAGSTVGITLVTPDGLGAALPGAFTYDSPTSAPSLSAVSPGSGPTTGGPLLLLTGQNFKSGASVFICGVKATAVTVLGTVGAVAVLPPNVEGTCSVLISNPDGQTSSLPNVFTYVVPELGPGNTGDDGLALALVQPPTGPTGGGGLVVLKGFAFSTGLSVRFGATVSPWVKVIDPTTAVARVPSGAGNVDVSVVSPVGKTATLTKGYLYLDTPGAGPTLTAVKPPIGPTLGGTRALVLGAGLANGALVFIDGIPASGLARVDSQSATILTPAGDAGPADVTWVNPDGRFAELPAGFVYISGTVPSVAVVSVVPVQGSVAGGTPVVISGSGFAPGAQVFFDGLPLLSTQVLGSKTMTALTLPHSAGLVDVQVTGADGWTGTLAGAFNFVIEQPFVAVVTPGFSLLEGGGKATIVGQGFHPQAKVQLDAVAASTKWLDVGHLEIVIPAGSEGLVDVTVTNPDGLSDTLDNGFEYLSELPGVTISLTAVTPNVGPTTGGAAVLLHGENLPSDAAVLFDSAVASDVTVIDDRTLLVTAPPGTVGAADIHLIAAGEGTVTLANAFFYYDPNSTGPWPSVSGIFPVMGPIAGGTIASIQVAPALAEASVFFGPSPGTVLGVDPAGTLVVRVPKAGGAGPVDVTVMHPDGKADTLVRAFTYYAPKPGQLAPLLIGVTPAAGSTSGGTNVTLAGARIVNGARSWIGYRPLQSCSWIGPTEMKCTTPPSDALGFVDAAVTNPDGLSSVLPAGFAYLPPKPNVTKVFPGVGSTKGGLLVVVSGADFHSQATVKFDGVAATDVVVHSSSVLVARTPAHLVATRVDVSVVNPGGLSGTLAQAFEYTDKVFTSPPPDVHALVPKVGPFAGGTVLAVYGTGFQAGAQILFGTSPAIVHRVNATFAVVTTPSGFVGPTDVTLLNADGQADTLAGGFTYLSPTAKAPKLYGVTPPSGPEAGGTPVILTGDFITGGGAGFIGYRPVSSWTVLNSSIGTGTTGAIEAGAHDAVVTNGDGQSATLSGAFTSVGAPLIDSFQPALGPVAGGTVITIAGKSFASGLSLWFGGVKATNVQVLSPFVVKATTPPGQPGPAEVRITNPDGQTVASAAPFEYLLPPEILAIFPAKGPHTGGTPVVISGAGLLPTSEVRFDAALATGVLWSDDTALIAFAPAGAIGKKADISVTNPDGQSAVLYDAFEWKDAATLGTPPDLVTLKPARGPMTGGTAGLATGADFATDSRMIFGSHPAAATIVYASTLASFRTSASEAGAVDVWLVTPNGLWDQMVDGFTYLRPSELGASPAITEIDPDRGPTKGGSVTTLAGLGLDGNAVVFFDKSPSPLVTQVSGGIDVTTPPHAAGLVDVTATNSDGQTVILPVSFRYVPPPTILKATPSAGPAAGGTFVEIQGQNFQPGALVLFCVEYAQTDDCTPAASVVYVDAQTVNVVTPAHSPDVAEIVLVNPDGQAAVLGGGFFFSPPPKILAIEPPTGSTLGGTVLTIQGLAFQPGATVSFGGIPGADVVVTDADHLTVRTPPGTAGPVVVVIRNLDGGTHTLAGGFKYVPPPLIATVFPSLGPETGGTLVTVQGSGFVVGAGGSVVKLGSTVVPSNKVQIVSTILIQFETPPGTGPQAVRVTNPDGQFAVLAGGFTYVPPIPAPKIASVAPPYGATGGGYIVKVTGNSFQDGVQVEFGRAGVWATGYLPDVKNNGTLIVVTAPAFPAGKADVRVTNSDGQSDVLPLAFEYSSPIGLPGLAFAGIDPKRGPTKGGYVTTVYGQGFKQGIRVYFGTNSTSSWTEAPKVLRLGPTALRVTMPVMPKGPADIRLSNVPLGGIPEEVIGTNAFVFGTGAIFVPKGHLLPIDVSRNDYQPVIVDVNGDGLNDVIVMHVNQRPDMFINTRDPETNQGGVFVDQTETLMKNADPGTYCFDMYHPRVVDYDHDGDKDVIFHRPSCSGHMHALRNAGDGAMTLVGISNVAFDDVRDLVVADFNCDGWEDIFLSRGFSRKDEMFVNDKKGSFYHAPNVLPSFEEPSRGAAAEDVDHDGDMDLVITNDVATQDRLYYNNCNNIQVPPSCSFDPPGCTMKTYDGHRYGMCKYGAAHHDARAICERAGMHLVDLDSQTEMDYVWTQMTTYAWTGYTDGAVEGTWRWSNGSTTPPAAWCGGENNGGTGENCGAINHYGSCMMDIGCGGGYWFTCESGNDVQCPTPWQFTDATYGTNKNFPSTGFDTWDVLVFDIDQDGWEDVFMGNNGQSSRIYMNALGNFLPDDGTRFPQTEANMNVIAADKADVDLDGDMDLILTKYIGSELVVPHVYLNDRADGGQGGFTNVTVTNVPARRTEDTRFLGLGDLNGDNLVDLYLSNWDSQDFLLLNHGYKEDKPNIEQNRVPIGSFANNTLLGYPEDGYSTNAGSLGDIDGDGDLDVVFGTAAGQLNRVWLNDGQGNFFDETTSRMPPNFQPDTRDIQLVDLNLDGDMDIVEADIGAIRMLVNNGSGYFKEVTAENLPTNPGVSWGGLDIGDLDKDGDMDIVAVASEYQNNWNLTTFINGGDAFNNDGAFLFARNNPLFTGGSYYVSGKALQIIDMNGDTWPDIYMGMESGQQNKLFFNDATARFTDVTFAYLSAIADSTRDVDLADFDKDGDIDIFVTNSGGNRLHLGELAYKLGDVTASNLPGGMTYDATGSVAADLDLDGYLDIFTTNWGQQDTMLLNDGSGFFSNYTDLLPRDADYGQGVLVGDLDNDGKPDLLTINHGVERILLNKTPE